MIEITITKAQQSVLFAWADRLEANTDKQTTHKLTRIAEDGSLSHCCLGVLMQQSQDAGINTSEPSESAPDTMVYFPVNGDRTDIGTGVLNHAACEWSGLSTNPLLTYVSADGYETTSAAADFNDYKHKTFPEIGKMVRAMAESAIITDAE